MKNEASMKALLFHHYHWLIGVIITAIVEIVIFIVSMCVHRKEKGSRSVTVGVILGAFFIFFSAVVSITANQYQKNYTTVPRLEMLTKQQAIEVIISSGLLTDYDHIRYVKDSQSYENNELVVITTEPGYGTLVKKGTIISIDLGAVEDSNNVSEIANTERDEGDYPIKEPLRLETTIDNGVTESTTDYTETSSGDNNAPISLLDSRNIRLSLHERSLQCIYAEGKSTRECGTNAIPDAEVILFDYENDYEVSRARTDNDGNIEFSNIADGTYYYSVECVGYKDIRSNLFKIEYNPDREGNVLPWTDFLDHEEANYSKGFKVKLVNKNGKPISYTDVTVASIRRDNNNNYTYSSLMMRTDFDGYLTMWYAEDDVEYRDIVTFFIKDNHTLMISVFDDIYYAEYDGLSDEIAVVVLD